MNLTRWIGRTGGEEGACMTQAPLGPESHGTAGIAGSSGIRAGNAMPQAGRYSRMGQLLASDASKASLAPFGGGNFTRMHDCDVHHASASRTAAALVAISLLAAGCTLGSSPPPVTAIPTSAAACEAMRPAFPLQLVSYDSNADTPVTVAEVKADNVKKKSANARYVAACP